MAWKLEGSYFENCSCDVGCPCVVTSLRRPADTERCRGIGVFRIDVGDIDGLDVAGLTLAVVFDAPQRMADGDWRVGLIVDDGASREQTEKLAAVFLGQLGGPPEMLSLMLGELLGVINAPLEYEDDGRFHRLRMTHDAQLEIEELVAPGSSEPTKVTGVLHHANSTVTLGQATKAHVRAFGLELSHDGKNGIYTPMAWSSEHRSPVFGTRADQLEQQSRMLALALDVAASRRRGDPQAHG